MKLYILYSDYEPQCCRRNRVDFVIALTARGQVNPPRNEVSLNVSASNDAWSARMYKAQELQEGQMRRWQKSQSIIIIRPMKSRRAIIRFTRRYIAEGGKRSQA